MIIMDERKKEGAKEERERERVREEMSV